MTIERCLKTVVLFLAVMAVTMISGCGDGNNNDGVNPPAASGSKQLSSFGFLVPASTGQINETDKTVAVEVPHGTDVSSLVAVFTTTGSEITVNEVAQESEVTANNFTNPVVYTVKAANGTTVNYTVTVVVAPNDSKDITAFTIPGQTSSDISGTEITVTMPAETVVTALVPEITHTGADIDPASGAARDFTNPVVYTVTAADSSSKQYTVTVNVPEETTKVFDFMTDGDALVRNAGSDWYFDGGYTGNYANGYGYYMSHTNIAAPWLFTGNFTVEFEFYLKLLDDEYIYRYAFRLVDPNWENNANGKFFDFAAYYTAFPALTDDMTPTYYQTGQGNGSYTNNDYFTGVPGARAGINTCTLVKTGNTITVSMNGTAVKTVTISAANLPSVGYAPFIHAHNSWDQADSNFYLRKVTVHYMSDEVVYHNWNEGDVGGGGDDDDDGL